MSFSYWEAIQVYLITYIILALGYIYGAFKLFDSKAVSGIRRTLYLICVPAMLFRQLAIQKMELKTWYPILISFLTQVTVHILTGIISFILPFSNKYLRFLESIFATSHINFMFYGYPIAKLLFGEEYIYVPLTCCAVLFLFTTPFHSALVYSPKSKNLNNESASTSSSEESSEKSSLENEENEKSEKIQQIEEEDELEPEKSQSQASINNQKTEKENSIQIQKTVKQQKPKLQKSKNQNQTLCNKVLWSFLNTLNICTILGIIWCSTGLKLPILLDQATYYLERCVVATGLFCSGVFMWEHPFFGCNWTEVSIYFVIHFVAIPLIAALWCWICKVPSKMSQLITLSHATPLGLTGYVMAINCGYGMQSASFTFFYSNLLSFPIFILWTVVFKECKLFN